MSLIVQKYGGTSVGNPERIQNVARRVDRHAGRRASGRRRRLRDERRDRRPDQARASEVSPNPERARDGRAPRHRRADHHRAHRDGDQRARAKRPISLTGAQAGIVTDGVHTKAKIANITPKQVHEHLDDGNIVIVAGFQGETTRRPHHHARPRRLRPHRHRPRRRDQGRRLPDLHRRGWRLHLRPAHRPDRAEDRRDQLRRNARNGLAAARRSCSRAPSSSPRNSASSSKSAAQLQQQPRNHRERRNRRHGRRRRPRRQHRKKPGQGHRPPGARPARHRRHASSARSPTRTSSST